MSINPFVADAAVAARIAGMPADLVRQVQVRARAVAVDGVIAGSEAAVLVASFGLSGVRELMLLLLDSAKAYAQPAISSFFVGAVGLEAPSGDLILGGNVEFPGTHLGYTLHGEGFVATRVFSRGAELAVIAIGEAHPCAHCRQFLAEFANSSRLELIDPLGHTLTLGQLYPWPFDPAYLGEPGAQPGPGASDMAFADAVTPAISAALAAAGRHAHAPYSKCPGAVALELADGRLIGGASIESVAFNPTISPLQAGLVNLLAAGADYGDIRSVTLATVRGGAVDYGASTRELLAAIAPQAELSIVGYVV